MQKGDYKHLKYERVHQVKMHKTPQGVDVCLGL